MKIISVRQQPEYCKTAIQYLQQSWPEVFPILYEDCVTHCIHASLPLPQWYLLENDGCIIGCAGLITNDFISRMDLYPWLCALYIDEQHRGHRYASLLIKHAKEAARNAGFAHLNLCTDLTGYYEKLGFRYIGEGYHPWETSSRIYQTAL